MLYFLTYPFFFSAIRLGLKLLGRLRSSGEENVPLRGGLIFSPNHISDADPPTVFVSFPRRAWFIGKEELFQIPVVGWFFHHFHAFPIKRDSADRAALKRAEACLRRGEPILVFPEGRCARDGKLQRIQPGAAMLSVRTGCPIIPVGLEHTNEVLPYGSLRPRFSKHPVTVTFGPAIRPQEFSDLRHSKAVEAVTKRLGEELARLTNQPAPPEAPATKRVAKTKDLEQAEGEVPA